LTDWSKIVQILNTFRSDQVQVERRESERIKGLKELIIKHMNSF